MKLWAMPYRAIQDRCVKVESSDKTWSTREGNGKPLQYSCLENPMNQPRQYIKKQRHYFANKGPSSQSYSFSSSHAWMWELDYKESWALKNEAFELWSWRRLLRVPWTARRLNPSVHISSIYIYDNISKQPTCPSAEIWINKKWYIRIKYYLA